MLRKRCIPRSRTRLRGRFGFMGPRMREESIGGNASITGTGGLVHDWMYRAILILGRKAKGRFPLRDLAPSVRFFEDLVRLPDHTVCHSGIARGLQTLRLATSSLFLRFSRCKNFLGFIQSSQLPGCFARAVAGSHDGPCLLSPSGRFLLR